VSEKLPQGWAKVRIDTLASFVRGVSFKKDEGREEQLPDHIPVLRAGNLQEGRIVWDDLVFVPGRLVSGAQRLRAGDIVVAMSSGSASVVGKAAPVRDDDADQPAGFGAFCGLWRTIDPNRIPWVQQYFQSAEYRQTVSAAAIGVNINNLRSDHIGGLEIPIPPLKEQRRIVAKLEGLQTRSRRAREALDAVPPLLEKLRQSILAAAFRGDLTKDWRAKNKHVEPATKLLERIRLERRKKWEESELAKMKAKGKHPTDDKWKKKYEDAAPLDTTSLPELPSGWCWAAFDELAFDSLYGPRFGAELYADEGFPTLRTTDLDDEGTVVWNNPPRVRVTDAEYAVVGLRPHDFVVTRTGATIGKCALYREGDARALPSAYLIRFGLISDAVDPEYTLQAMLSPAQQAGLRGGATATAQPNVNARTIARLALPIAPRAEQVQILSVVVKAFARLNATRTSYSEGQAAIGVVERSVLAKAFRGELVPQNLDDEAADAMPAPAPASTPMTRPGEEAKPTRRARGQASGARQEDS